MWRVASVRAVGAKVVVSIRVGDSVTSEALRNAALSVRQELIDRGWLQTEVCWDTFHRQDGVHVEFVVRTGRRARVAGWWVEGNSSLAAARIFKVLPRRGAWFSKNNAELATTALLRLYETNGFPFASVRAGAIRESLGWVVPTLLVEEGQKVNIDFLAFEGQRSVTSVLLRRAARFRPGLLFSPSVIRQWRRNLERLGWLRCDSQALVVDGGRYGMRFWLTELLSNRVSGSMGYSYAEGFVGFASLNLQNLLNTGRRLSASWRMRSAQRGYELSYTEPWLLGSIVSVTGRLGHTALDTTQASTEAELQLAVMTGDVEIGLVNGWQRITSRPAEGNFSTAWVGTSFDFDVRDGFPFLIKGFRLATRTGVGRRQDYYQHAGRIVRFAVGFQSLMPLITRIVWSTVVETRVIFSGESLTIPEQYLLGGTSGLRGFAEDAFVTSAAVWVNLEIRYMLSRTTQAYPFVDVGACQQPEGPVLAASCGCGIRWLTRLGTMGLDYGVPLGSDLLRGKVHFRLESGF